MQNLLARTQERNSPEDSKPGSKNPAESSSVRHQSFAHWSEAVGVPLLSGPHVGHQ